MVACRGVKTLRTQDTLDQRHFGTSAEVSVRHLDTSAPVPNCPDISALVPKFLTDTGINERNSAAPGNTEPSYGKEDGCACIYVN